MHFFLFIEQTVLSAPSSNNKGKRLIGAVLGRTVSKEAKAFIPTWSSTRTAKSIVRSADRGKRD